MTKKKKTIDICTAKLGTSDIIIDISDGGGDGKGKGDKKREGGGGANTSGGSSSTSTSRRANLQSLLPKDIAKQLVSTEGKTAWKDRKGSMEAVIKACADAYYSIEHNKYVY